MKHHKRIEKLEGLAKIKAGKTIHQIADEMSAEEAERIVKKAMNAPREPLYVKTKDGYVDIYKIESDEELRIICGKYTQKKIKLFDTSELKQMGVEPGIMPVPFR